MRACAPTRTHAGAAIFVHLGVKGALKMCVRVHAYTVFLVWTCTDVRRKSIKPLKSIKFSKKKYFFEKCAGAGARAGAKNGVRVRAPHSIKMCAMCVRVQLKIRAH